MPLGCTADDEMIMVPATGTVDEEAEVFFSGIPLLVRRIGLNWYLVVHEV